MLTLRYYQREAVDSIWAYFESGATGNPIVAMPTGTGKSLVIATFVHEALARYPRARILVLTHVKELVDQNVKALLKQWPGAPAGIHSAGLNRRDVLMPVIYGNVQSARKSKRSFGRVDLLIVDECHLCSDKDDSNYQAIIERLKADNPSLRVIGFSATHWRMKGGELTNGKIFTDVCYDLTATDAFNRLVAEGYLCPLIPKATSAELDVSGVKVTAGEFNLKALGETVDQSDINLAVIREMLTVASHYKHWLVFASSISHAEHVNSVLESFGVESATIHSEVSSGECDKRLADFKVGKLRCIVNNNKLTTGFDFPAIDLIVMPDKPGITINKCHHNDTVLTLK